MTDTPTREQVAQALVDDAWEGHEGPLTIADLEAIAGVVMPLIEAYGRAERVAALREAADAIDRTNRTCKVKRSCHEADAITLRERAELMTLIGVGR